MRYFRDARGEHASDLAALGALFDTHVLELAGLEDLAALQTLDELSFFVATHDLHTRVFAGLLPV